MKECSYTDRLAETHVKPNVFKSITSRKNVQTRDNIQGDYKVISYQVLCSL